MIPVMVPLNEVYWNCSKLADEAKQEVEEKKMSNANDESFQR